MKYSEVCRPVAAERPPVPKVFRADPCSDGAWVCDGCVQLQSLGRVVEVSVRLKAICPGRELAVAVSLTELLPNGRECRRGMKVLAVPPLPGEHCRDLLLPCISFAVPDPPACCCQNSHCQPRRFAVRTMANYLDGGFSCCSGL